MTADQASVRDFPCSPDFGVSLAHYPPGGAQPPHVHDFTQLSFLLGGELLERHGRREWTPFGCAVGLKPAGIPHDNQWGREGALIFSVKLRGGELAAAAEGEPGWSRLMPDPVLRELVRACLLPSGPEAREDAVWGLLSLSRGPPAATARPPRWLARAREAIRDAPEHNGTAAAARVAGVHRGHFSAVFRSCYGMPPSVFRRNLLVARAIGKIARSGDPLTRIAHEVGFSDQAHLSRSVKAAAGLGPRALRALLA